MLQQEIHSTSVQLTICRNDDVIMMSPWSRTSEERFQHLLESILQRPGLNEVASECVMDARMENVCVLIGCC